MGYARNPATGKIEPVTEVTGTINAACGCRIPYNDNYEGHRLIRLGDLRIVWCWIHGEQRVKSCAVTGPVEKLIPDSEERAEFERDMLREKS